MYPHSIALPLGFTVSAHNALVGSAVVVSILLVVAFAPRLEQVPRLRTLAAMLVAVLGAFALGRAHYVLIRSGLDPADLLRLDRNIHAGGAILGTILGCGLGARLFSLPLGRLADACAPVAGIGVAIARMGCLVHGCCFGGTCSLPWCFPWPAGTLVHEWHWRAGIIPQDAPFSPPLHPLQIYFALLGLLVTVVALAVRRRKHYDGEVALLALALFTGGSALLEFLRVDYAERPYWGPLPQLAWTALALFAATLALLAWGAMRHRRSLRPATGPALTAGGAIARRSP
jgi:phosphatidylglycerol:prolipoprotein diacylglycerol transferase